MEARLNTKLLAEKMSTRRAQCNLNLRELSEYTSISPATLCRIEQGKMIDADTLIRCLIWLDDEMPAFIQYPNKDLLTRYDEDSGLTCAYIKGYSERAVTWGRTAVQATSEFRGHVPSCLGEVWHHDTNKRKKLTITQEFIDSL